MKSKSPAQAPSGVSLQTAAVHLKRAQHIIKNNHKIRCHHHRRVNAAVVFAVNPAVRGCAPTSWRCAGADPVAVNAARHGRGEAQGGDE